MVSNKSSIPLFSLALVNLKIAPMLFAYYKAYAYGTSSSSDKSILFPTIANTKINANEYWGL